MVPIMNTKTGSSGTGQNRPVWWKRAVLAVSAIAAVIASFAFLRELAIHAGWPVWTAPLLPLCLDTLGAAALTEYHQRRTKTAAAVSIGTITASVVGNSVSHLVTTGFLTAAPGTGTPVGDTTVTGWVIVTTVGAVPAITVGLIVHLFANTSTSTSTPKTSTETKTSTPPPPPPATRKEPRTWKPEPVAWTQTPKPDAGTGSSSSGASSTDIHTAQPHPTKPVSTTSAGTAKPPADFGDSKRKSTTKRPSRDTRTIEELAATAQNQGWENLSATRLTPLLAVSKQKACQVRKHLDHGTLQSTTATPVNGHVPAAHTQGGTS